MCYTALQGGRLVEATSWQRTNESGVVGRGQAQQVGRGETPSLLLEVDHSHPLSRWLVTSCKLLGLGRKGCGRPGGQSWPLEP